MAEVVGTVAASIELGKVVLELKELVSSLRHAKEDIDDLLIVVTSLEDILAALALQDAHLASFIRSDVAAKTRDYCDNVVRNLLVVCSGLVQSIKQSRFRGSIKAVFQRNTVEKALKQVQMARENLILAQSLDLKYMYPKAAPGSYSTNEMSRSLLIFGFQQQQVQQTTLQTIMAQTRPPPSSPSQQILALPTTTPIAHSILPSPTTRAPPIDDFRLFKGSRSSVRVKKLFVLRIAVLGKAYEAVQQYAFGTWTYGFKSYNIQPDDAPVFAYVSDGDIIGLQSLLTARLASVYDRDSFGQTLLFVCNQLSSHKNPSDTFAAQYASGKGHVPMMKFLLLNGVDPNERNAK